MIPVSFTIAGGSKSDIQAFADEFGGTVERAGLMRWSLTFDRDMPDAEAEALLERMKSEFGGVEVDR